MKSPPPQGENLIGMCKGIVGKARFPPPSVALRRHLPPTGGDKSAARFIDPHGTRFPCPPLRVARQRRAGENLCVFARKNFTHTLRAFIVKFSIVFSFRIWYAYPNDFQRRSD